MAQLEIYHRLLKHEVVARTVEAPYLAKVLKDGALVDEKRVEKVVENDVRDETVRVLEGEYGYIIRLDNTGVGAGVGLIAFERCREVALDFAMKVDLATARELYTLHKTLEAFTAKVAAMQTLAVAFPSIPFKEV